MAKKYNDFLRIILFFVFLSFLPQIVNAQCAGDDAAFTVCDIPNPSSKTINLFSLLGGSPVAGGVWEDDNSSGGLNVNTGILNAQVIRASGIYRYTYTVTGNAGCIDNSATITVTIGGYSGVTSPNVSVCSSVVNFNLFQAFNGVDVSPQFNGQWHNDTTNENVVGSSVNVEDLEGTFYFTYTMPAIGTCPAMSSTAIVTVFRAPDSGQATPLILCASDGLSGYTDFDLYSLISGHDAGGYWREGNTGELTFKGDHNVNIQRIYNTYGAGTYGFNYVVPSTNPICADDQTTLIIRLEDKLDFTGAIVEVNSDICETEISTATYNVTITKGPANIPNGTYFVEFIVSGHSGSEKVSGNFVNGVLTFPINSIYFNKVGIFTVNILKIYPANSAQACQNIINNLSDDLIIYPIPDLSGAVITPAVTCQDQDAVIQISNAVKLADGDYDIVYKLSGATNVSSQVTRITVLGGNATFVVPEIFNSRSGTTTVTITAITHVVSQCVNAANLSGEILINPLPNGSLLRLQIQNVCFGEEVTVNVLGLQTLTDVTLSYKLSGSNISNVETVVLNPVNGSSSFVIPSNLLVNSGSTTISIIKIKNNITTCESDVTGISGAFMLNPTPAAPLVNNQEFCKKDQSTIANLQPQGVQYKWYISATEVTPLPNTYVLKSEDYFVKETSAAGCVSPAAQITVTINDIPAPTLNQDGQNFCGLDNPTILDLSNNTGSPSTVVWYDAPNSGNLLSSTTPLVDKATYYGFDFSSTLNCVSQENISVTVSLIVCDSPEYTFFVPDGFSPNGDGINDTFTIPDIDFLYPNYSLEIFNRYGNGMYKGFKNKPAWDGINYEQSGIGGGIAPNGVYFYILYFNKDNRPPQQGRLYLNR
ncbi:gliding motility-associated C-terminal domain-containing protein [Flavobacterium sp. CF108]|uniref:gliding motility-associated C-terminal domain-containing protein n=1 Tax=unclassified Flavobacterium TaxID=196869 RepID=UPI0008CAD7B2|nr:MULTISPECIES: gliding motility-associated C-terminal domain-containing protein [unclassified Flavobacterium]SEO78360.1 gliding motility-associated C-terminal domain-containing protein [Flavobacterium sp. fv08]SHG77369.1 gliding motility-associated C-terminal domain-containing protein [Flavobacterium sp. CF108]